MKLAASRLKIVASIIAGSGFWGGCGQSNFSGDGAKTVKSSKATVVPESDNASTKLPEAPANVSAEVPVASSETKESFTTQTSESYAPIDIVFLVDTSGSMDAEKALLEANLATFLQSLDKGGSSFDYQVFVVSNSFMWAGNNARVEIVPAYIDSVNALNVMQYFFEAHGFGAPLSLAAFQRPGIISAGIRKAGGGKAEEFFADYKPTLKLRAAAVKEFIVVTDDNASGIVNILEERMGGIIEKAASKGIDKRSRVAEEDAGAVAMVKAYLSGIQQLALTNIDAMIFKEGSEESDTCTKASFGTAYEALAVDPEVGGKIFDLCSKSWGGLLEGLGDQLKQESLVYAYKLTQPAQDVVEVHVNGKLLAPDLFRFSAESNTVILAEKSIAAVSDVVDIRYRLK